MSAPMSAVGELSGLVVLTLSFVNHDPFPTSRSIPRSGGYGNLGVSLRFYAGDLHDFCPLLGLVREKLTKIGRRNGQYSCPII
jgi:hypothetical protein